MKHVGVLGYPIKHSISPLFQQAALDERGIDARYERFEVSDSELPAFLETVRNDEWLGVNITIPHKEAALTYMDQLSTEVRSIGALNTVVNDRSVLVGANTDIGGFLNALESQGHSVGGSRAVVLGSGGAARAVVAGLQDAEAEFVVVVSRTFGRAQALVTSLTRRGARPVVVAVDWDEAGLRTALRQATLLVNATPIGMRGGGAEGKSPVSTGMLHRELTVFDAVYNPTYTPLLRDAREAGATTISGLDMLVYQGAEAFELWTGVEAPIETMMAAAREALEGWKAHV